MDDADQPEPEGIPADLAERIDAVRERADQLAARVAEFSEDQRTAGGEQEPNGARSGPRRFAAWLFERRPPRSVPVAEPDQVEPVSEPGQRPRPAPISLAFEALAAAEGRDAAATPEPVVDQQAPTAPDGPESPVDQEGAAVEPDPEPTVEAEPAAEAQPPAAEGDGQVARPRPFAGAPLVYQKPAAAAAASNRDPIADFFTRKDDDDERKRWRRKKKKKEDASVKSEQPEDKPSDKPGKRKPWPKAARTAFRTLIVVAIAVVAALLLRAFVVEPYYVPSQSMEPTLHGCKGCNDDHVLVEKLSYLFHDPQPGDIVVFNRPATWKVPDDVLIKRVVGVPGDDIRLRGGKVYRNGARLDEPYVNQKCRHGTLPRNGSLKKKVYPPVPNGDVFVMGDNRCNSEDSRYFGVVPQSKIIGRAFLIIWPFSRIHSLS